MPPWRDALIFLFSMRRIFRITIHKLFCTYRLHYIIVAWEIAFFLQAQAMRSSYVKIVDFLQQVVNIVD